MVKNAEVKNESVRRNCYLQPSELRDPGNNLVVRVNDLASYPGAKRQNDGLKKKDIMFSNTSEQRRGRIIYIVVSHSNH